MIIDDSLWHKLLGLKDTAVSSDTLGWTFNGESFSEILNVLDIDDDIQALLLKSDLSYKQIQTLLKFKVIKIPINGLSLLVNNSVSDDLQSILKNYWPLSVLGHLKNDLPYIFIHSAISLDGYLATTTGHSQWIGNEDNLTHAHRLRALFDAVLIGGNTVLNDKPSLNVRHVEGKNPKRLILSNKCENLSSLKKVSDCKTYLFRDSGYNYNDCSNDFDKIIYFHGGCKKEKMFDLLQKCKQEKIKSILVEGGGTTLSTFIETKFANTLQFHMSPMLFGGGIKAVKLPNVNQVDESHKLSNMYVTQIGNSFMITAGLES